MDNLFNSQFFSTTFRLFSASPALVLAVVMIIGALGYLLQTRNIRKFITFFWESWITIAFIFSCSMILLIQHLNRQPSVYSSIATIEIFQETENGNQIYDNGGFNFHQGELLKSDTLATHIIRKHQPSFEPHFQDEDYKALVTNQPELIDIPLSIFRDSLSVMSRTESNLIEIEFVHTNPNTAALVANSIMYEFYGRDLLNTGLREVESEERLLERFKEEHILGTINEQPILEEYKPPIRNKDGVLERVDLVSGFNEYAFRKNQLELLKNNFKDLTDSLKNISYSGDKTVKFAKVVDRARPALSPFKPNRMRFLISSFVFSFYLALGLAFFIWHMDESIKTTSDIKSLLNKRVIGGIPVLSVKKMDEEGLEKFRNSRDPIYRAMSQLRANIEMHTNNVKPFSIQVTSSVGSEGKTTTALGLAMSFAKSGHKTLLIDCDLHRPRFLVPRGKGLTHALTTGDDQDKHVCESEYENLSIMGSGSPVEDPSALLITPAFNKLVDLYKAKFDYVILDSPPVVGMADASIIAEVADATIFIVQTKQLRAERVKAAIDRFDTNKTNIIGVVLSRFKIPFQGYFGIGYTYDYDYSYGSKDKGQLDPDESPPIKMTKIDLGHYTEQ